MDTCRPDIASKQQTKPTEKNVMSSKQARQKPAAFSIAAILIAITISILAIQSALAEAQSTKGRQQQQQQQNSYAAPSPVTLLRQQQQQSYASRPQASSTPSTTTSSSLAGPTVGSTKRKQPIVQQQQLTNSYSSPRAEQVEQQANTEDPLADSEPALYGSVAGAPGVDFPAYTRIPKTSFTCEGKGFDFGFYADEEAQCQVYHVCWSGRRESFLCGVGTVFNQAILACDYWHSVDCSKSSQFYGVNSELGKASSEPTSSGSQRIQPARSQASLPQGQASQSQTTLNYGSPVNQRRQQQPPVQQQYDSDSNFELPQQQQQQQLTSYNKSPPSKFAANQQQPSKTSQSYEYQQRVVHSNQPVAQLDTKSSTPRQPPATTTTTTLATPVVKSRPRFNMDLSQKVNSLIDSPVRPPIKQQQVQTPASPAAKQRQTQQKQQPANYAQMAVARAQQSGSQTLNPGPSRKSSNSGSYQQQASYDNELEGPQQQQQQQQPPQQQQSAFDDSPVQTSTANYAMNRQVSTQANVLPQPQQQTIVSGGGSDGSSAITTQYDSLSNNGNQNNGAYNSNINEAGPADNSADSFYESSALTNDDGSLASEDFRSAGARAAASHNQNWYIMRTI